MKNSPVRVLLIGAAGRMGKTVQERAQNDPDIEIAALCDLGDSIERAMDNCDAAIDFSQAASIDEICRIALRYGKPLIIGDDWSLSAATQKGLKRRHAPTDRFVVEFQCWSERAFLVDAKAAELLGSEFNPEIVETHHKMKKDAPSGTAKTLAEILKTVRNMEIPIQSIREGDVVGEHTVVLEGPGESLELTHRAANREIFALGGAIISSEKWIVQQPSGLYSMQDVLGL